MVKVNGCAAIDFRPSVSLFCRRGGVFRRFPFGKWRLLTWETKNSKHSKCMYTCEIRRGTTGISLQIASKSSEYPHRSLPFRQAMHGGNHFSLPPNCETHLASNARVYTPVQSCWGNTQTPERFQRNRLRSCGADLSIEDAN